MVATIVILSVLLAATIAALVLSIMLNRRLAAFASRFEDNYTDAQDILDETYRELDGVLNRAMISDDPVARRVMAQLGKCREDVFRVAKLISMQEDE